MRESPTLARQAERLSVELIDRAAEAELHHSPGAAVRVAAGGRRTLALALLTMGPVLLVGPAMIVAAASLFVAGGVGRILVGVLLLLLAYLSHPRREKRPEPVVTLDARQAPRAFALLRIIAEALGAPRVHELEITSTGSARIDVVGWRRRRTIALAAPIWVGLEPSARVALLTHEVAHLVRRELVVVRLGRRALATLDEWWQLFGGQRSIEDVKPDSERNALSWGTRLMWAPVRLPTGWYHRVLVRRLAPLCTSGEILADLDASTLAGREGVIAMLDAYLSRGTSEVALSRARQNHDDLETALRDAKSALRPEIRAGRREAAAAQGTRVDPLHPSTALRLRRVTAEPSSPGTVRLSDDDSAALDDELRPWTRMALKEAAERMAYTRDGVRERRKMPPGWTYELWG